MLKKVVYGPHSSSTNVDVFSYQLKKEGKNIACTRVYI